MSQPSPSPSPQQEQPAAPTFEVQLAIYDLSHGMARNLSAQFLGPHHAIEIIPHTALVVFGREYYFGGGIQSVLPHEFRRSTGMVPIQTASLGRTRVNQQEFEQWCRDMMQRGLYHAAAYDLLQRNCNNFCHDAALRGLQLSQGVPAWILDVPRRFLASPMGQLVRPMLEQMQVTAPPVGSESVTLQPPVNTNMAFATAAATPVAQQANPWASLPTAKPPAQSSMTRTKSLRRSVRTPYADSIQTPLRFKDTTTVRACISRLSVALDNAAEEGEQEVTNNRKAALASIATILVKGQTPGEPDVEKACEALMSLFSSPAITAAAASSGDNTVALGLMYLRLLVLYLPPESLSSSAPSSWRSCLEWIHHEVVTGDASSPINPTLGARALAWAVLSNAISLVTESKAAADMPLVFLLNNSNTNSNTKDWLEFAVADWLPDSQPRTEIRAAVAILMCNIVWARRTHGLDKGDDDEELSDAQVTLLCAALTNLSAEPDFSIRFRRLLAATWIVKNRGANKPRPLAAAARLIRDLDFTVSLRELVDTIPHNSEITTDAGKCRVVAIELLSLVRSLNIVSV